MNEDWRIRFEKGAVRNLPKIKSDHCPILIGTNGFAPLPIATKPLRIEAAWLHHEHFEEFVLTHWNNQVPLMLS